MSTDLVRTFWTLGRVIGVPLLCAAWLASATAAVITEEAGLVPTPTAARVAAPTGQGDAAIHSERLWSTFAGSHSLSFDSREASGAPFWQPAAIIFGEHSAPYDSDFDDLASDLVRASGFAPAPAPPTKPALRPQSGAGPDLPSNWAKDLAAQLGIATSRSANRYSAISLDGDVAEIGLGAKAIRSIHTYHEISLANDAAMTGLKNSHHYNPISLNGDAADVVFSMNTTERRSQTAAVHSMQSDNTLLGYATGLVYFLSSRDALPYFFGILIGYVAVAGIQSLIARFR